MRPIAKRLAQAAATTKVKMTQRLALWNRALRRIFWGVALNIIDQSNANKHTAPESQATITRVGKGSLDGSSTKTNPETTTEMSSRSLASRFFNNLGKRNVLQVYLYKVPKWQYISHLP